MSIAYDPTLVMLSIFVAIIVSLTGVAVTFGGDVSPGHSAPKSPIGGAATVGGCIWPAHFIAILALKFPAPIDHSPTETLLSLCSASFFAGVGLAIASVKALGALKVPTAAAIVGGGIGSTHDLGMSAIRGYGIAYGVNWVAVSLAVAIVASGVALWLALQKHGAIQTLLAGAALGLATAGMQHTGLYATSFYPLAVKPDVGALLLSQAALGFSVAVAAPIICGYYLFLFSSMLTHDEA